MNTPHEQSMEQLHKRYKTLYDQKIRVETELKNTQQQLAQHKETAKKTWGTDDIEELKLKLETIKAENEKKRADYQIHLDTIEKELLDLHNKNSAT